MKHFINTTLALLITLYCSAAYANEPTLAPDTQAITEFAKLIRWSGVVTSVFVIAVAWFLLRFVHRLVEQISDQLFNADYCCKNSKPFFNLPFTYSPPFSYLICACALMNVYLP